MVNLRFMHDRIMSQKKIRPGFSARRYLSRLTRSLDEEFLDKVMSKGNPGINKQKSS